MNDPDPAIPFRVSHATAIAQTATRVSMLMWIMGSAVTISGVLLTVLLTKGGG